MTNYVDPSRANFDAFKALPRNEPIHMLNLLQFRDKAAYPEGHQHADKGWSGRRAYHEYGAASGSVFTRVGGTIIWRGVFQTAVTGPEDMQWDNGFIAAYPNADAFFEMINDPVYQRSVVNRTAALIDSRLVRFSPGKLGDDLG